VVPPPQQGRSRLKDASRSVRRLRHAETRREVDGKITARGSHKWAAECGAGTLGLTTA
jgi:hypothetical protein